MNRIKAIVIALIVFIGVFNLIDLIIKKPEVINLNGGKVELIGHAGSGFTYLLNPWNPLPSNSLASIDKAFLNGAEGVEVDIQVSADSALILFHDLQLNSKTELTGCVFQYHAAELLNTNYKLGFPYDWFQSEKIYSFKQLETNIAAKEKYKLYLDLKLSEQCENGTIENQIVVLKNAMINHFNNSKINQMNVTLISNNTILLKQLKQILPLLNYAIDCDTNIEQDIEIAKLNGFKSLCISGNNATQEITKKIHDNGLEVILYGGKSKLGLRKMLELNPDVVQVNNVKAMHQLLN